LNLCVVCGQNRDNSTTACNECRDKKIRRDRRFRNNHLEQRRLKDIEYRKNNPEKSKQWRETRKQVLREKADELGVGIWACDKLLRKPRFAPKPLGEF
jgi:hypothetical protein